MMALNIVYILLIVAAIILIPLRITARRRTLKEIDALRSSMNKDMKELMVKLGADTVTEKEKSTHSLQAHLRENMRYLFDYISMGAPVLDVVRALSTRKLSIEQYRKELERQWEFQTFTEKDMSELNKLIKNFYESLESVGLSAKLSESYSRNYVLYEYIKWQLYHLVTIQSGRPRKKAELHYEWSRYLIDKEEIDVWIATKERENLVTMSMQHAKSVSTL